MQLFGVLLLQIVLLYPQAVEAAEVVIDSTVSTNAAANTFAGAQTAFTDDQTGYTFIEIVITLVFIVRLLMEEIRGVLLLLSIVKLTVWKLLFGTTVGLG